MYNGQWIGDMKEGDGIETYRNGKTLHGVWKKGKIWEGTAKQNLDNGKTWTASWVNGVKQEIQY